MSELMIERRGAVALLTLSNPAKRNALDPPLLDALCAALARLPGEGARAAVLTGEGDRMFSSGYDLAALPEGAVPGENPLARALAAITDGDLPVIAALNGPAIGGGCELAATCDLRVAHPQVTLTMPPVKLGIVYAPRGLARFVALIGASRTRELFLTAAPVDAARALAWGLVDRVVPPADVLPAALALADEIARHAPLAIRGTRRALERLLAELPPEAAAELAELQRAAWISDDAREARAAFREKRPPRFTGK
ncbi:MAG TPA: enoyl-CoA hydratase-related protein [Polyangia bacterium]|nr:enoyl-CoA hydratase-related protein [Polyangia bacterium]